MTNPTIEKVVTDTTTKVSGLAWKFPRLTDQAVWHAAIATAQREKAGEIADSAKLYVDGARVLDADRWPGSSAGDDDHATWRARVADGANGELPIMFFARGLQEHDRTLFEIVLDELAPALLPVGLPSGLVETELFYGRYAATPGGIHRESCTNLHLVLLGQKVMHMWVGEDWIPADAKLKLLDTSEPTMGTSEQYLMDLELAEAAPFSIALPATAGEGFFWRSGVWHVAEAPKASMAMNIASYTNGFEPDPERLAVHIAEDGSITRDWLAEYRDFSRSADADGPLLARVSALGMTGPPPETEAPSAPAPAPAAIAAHAYRRRSAAPLVWLNDADELLAATHGAWRPFPPSHAKQLAAVANTARGDLITLAPEYGSLATWLVANALIESAH